MTTTTLFLTLTLALRCYASTIEDSSSQWSYSGWSNGACSGCPEKPDASQASGGSWHETISSSASASIQNPGTSATVYGILPANPDGRATYGTNITIFVDGQPQGTFLMDLSGMTSYQYGVGFATVGGPGVVRVVNNNWEGGESVALLDYLDVQGAPTTTTTSAPTPVTPPGTTATSSGTTTSASSNSASPSSSSSASLTTTILSTSTDSTGATHTIPIVLTLSQSSSSAASSPTAAPVALISKKSMTALKVFIPIGVVLALLTAIFFYLHRQRAARQSTQDYEEGAMAYSDGDNESQNEGTLMGEHAKPAFGRYSMSQASHTSPVTQHVSLSRGIPETAPVIDAHKSSDSWGDESQYAADLLAGAEAALSAEPRQSMSARPGTGSTGVSTVTPRVPRVVWQGEGVRDSGARFGEF